MHHPCNLSIRYPFRPYLNHVLISPDTLLTLPSRTSLVAEVRPAQQIKKRDLRLNPIRHHGRLTPVITQSRPASPALGNASQSDNATSTHSPASSKSRAQRFALVHLLAVNPATQKDILRRTSISADICIPLLEKLADRDSTCWRLRAKFFKELDVWRFPYSSKGERQSAIDNAIKAFDRQRLSAEDKLWQLLLPPDGRNLGRTLSRLGFTNTPLLTGAKVQLASNSAAVSTPDHRSGPPSVVGTATPRQATQEISHAAQAVHDQGGFAPVEAIKTASNSKEQTHLEVKKSTMNRKRKMDNSSFKPSKSVVHSDDGNDSQEPVVSNSSKEPPNKRHKTKYAPDIASSPFVTETKPLASSTVKVKPGAGPESNVESKPSKTAKTDPSIAIPTVHDTKLERPLRTKQELTGLGINITSGKLTPSAQKTAAPSQQTLSPTQNQHARVPVPAVIGKVKQSSVTYHEKPSSTSSSASSFFDRAAFRSVASSQSSISPPILKAKPFITRQAHKVSQKRRGSDQELDQATKKRKTDAVTTQKPSPLASSPSINASDDTVSPHDSQYTFRNNAASANLDYPGISRGKMVQTRAGVRNAGGTVMIKRKTTSTELEAVVEVKNPGAGSNKSTDSLTLSPSLSPSHGSKPAFQAPQISNQELEARADLVLNEYLRIRSEVDECFDKDITPSTGKRRELWEKHREYQQLFVEHGTKEGGGNVLMASLSKNSAAYLDMKYVRLAKTYNHLVGIAGDEITNLSDEQKEELRSVYDEISQIKTLVEHSNERQQAARTRVFIEQARGNTSPSSPPSRCQTLNLYKQFYRDMAAYKDYLDRLRLNPAYPYASTSETEKATRMCTRLVGVRKDLEYGFNAMVEKASFNPSGRVTLAEEGGSVMNEQDAEAFIEQLKLDAVEWQRRREVSLGRLGSTTPEEVASLFDELERLTVKRYVLLRAAALDYGDREEGDLGELDLVTFSPNDHVSTDENHA